MRITFLGQAGLYIETRDASILCDPWFNPAYFASWFPFPSNEHIDPARIGSPTYLYVSHLHHDHYDPRYLAGIVLFNRHEFFEAHEVWEDLWMDTPSPDKSFYQGLIQAAVGLCHFANGNLRGAAKLFGSSRAYMERYGPLHLGMDAARFWHEMARCFAPVLAAADPDRQTIALDLGLVPLIALDPPPGEWPDPAEFLETEDD